MLPAGRYNLLQEPTNHFITGKRNNRGRSGSQQISCTTTVKTGKAFLLEHLLNTVNNPGISDFTISGLPLLLQPGTHYLIIWISIRTTETEHERTGMRGFLGNWPSTAV
jgi:hypothetical protein